MNQPVGLWAAIKPSHFGIFTAYCAWGWNHSPPAPYNFTWAMTAVYTLFRLLSFTKHEAAMDSETTVLRPSQRQGNQVSDKHARIFHKGESNDEEFIFGGCRDSSDCLD